MAHKPTAILADVRAGVVATLCAMILVASLVVPVVTMAAEQTPTGAGVIIWAASQASTPALSEFDDMGSPHGGYTMTSTKCQVCHSSHRSDVSGAELLVDGDGGCVFCHGATSAVGSMIKISADGPAYEQGGFANEDSSHGTAGSCAEYECHPRSPHGGGVSQYGAARGAMLSDDVDPLIAAALASGATNQPQTAVLSDEWVTQELGADFASIAIYQPDLDGEVADAVTEPETQQEIALGRAIVTGYVCMNHGCHINGAFNALSPDATVGEYQVTVNGVQLANGSGSTDSAGFGVNELRTRPIGGHGLRQSKGERAYASCGTCASCHDAKDPRRGNETAFPHSNAVWRAADASQPASVQAYGYVKLYTDAAWFTVAGSVDQVRENTTSREITGETPTSGRTLTVAMDGACLKCHRSGTPGNERGVGIDF